MGLRATRSAPVRLYGVVGCPGTGGDVRRSLGVIWASPWAVHACFGFDVRRWQSPRSGSLILALITGANK